ncbi:MAG: cytochrome c oxidase accessory protein CcoG [Deltaproteobacteria bacterium]
MSEIKENEVSYRDRISTVDEKGNRKWIYPKKPSGYWYNKRKLVSYLLLLLLFVLPFIKYKGEPLFLLNVLERKFIILGVVFTPQDTHLFAIGMILLIIFIVFFTFVFGRLFCGWVCPQTIFMEMVYRRIEYAIEGDAHAQIRLNKGPWNWDKIWKKTLKHIIFLVLAFIFISLLLSLIVGIESIFEAFLNPGENKGLAGSILIISLMFYYIFAFFREQVCTNVCPYGRMQGVLLVDNSIVVHYDFVRGEQRGTIKQRNLASNTEEGKKEEFGDCIDCNNCVDVCPTGIDIRNGTQLECINCTACMDACDEVMVKMKKPKGLIRYSSEISIKERKAFKLSKRAYAYIGVLSVIMVIFGFIASQRVKVEALILKTPGASYQYVPGDSSKIFNLYEYKLINKTSGEIENVRIEVEGIKDAQLQVVPDPIEPIKEFSLAKGNMILTIPVSEMKGYKTPVIFNVYSGKILLHKYKSNFSGPH